MRKKKKKEPPNVTKILSNVMLKLHNMDGIVKYEKKIREPSNVTKKLSHVVLKLHNVKMEPSNVRKKNHQM